jgi:outer membrane murein-binding lipoprotein Lpp
MMFSHWVGSRRLPAIVGCTAVAGALIAGCGNSSKVSSSASASDAIAAQAQAVSAAPPSKQAVRSHAVRAFTVGTGANLTYENGNPFPLAPGRLQGVYITCPSGMQAIGGGELAANTAVVINDSLPYNSASGRFGGPADSWDVFATNTARRSYPLTVYTVCLAAS